MSERMVTVYEVLADGVSAGPAGDGTHIHRFLDKRAAEDFAARATCYGSPADVRECNAPLRIARRWGLA